MTALPPFQELVDRHRHELWRFLVARVGQADAADLLQDTFLSALQAYPDLRDGTNLRGWLFVVARSRIVDGWRRAARRPLPGTVPERPTSGPEPPDDALWAAVDALPDGQRDAVLLRYVADLPYRDIGDALGCSEAAARQRVRAALTRLREEDPR